MSSPEIKKIAESARAPYQESKSPRLIAATPNSTFIEAGDVLSTRFDSLQLMSNRWDADFYLAHDGNQGSDGPTALKVFPPQASGDLKRLELFLLEAFTAARLTHSNIIRASEPEQINGIYYCRIDHRPEAETLKDLLDREGWLDISWGVGIITQIASALEYAHQRGILHLRIQPENILIAPDGTAFLTDFGIEERSDLAWAHAERSSRCAIHYISPEQASGLALDSRSDLYSLGVVLYQLLTDRLPVDSEDPESVKQKHLTQSPLSPHLYLSDIPVALSGIVTCLLEKDPAKRFQNVASFRAALDACLGEPNKRGAEIESSPCPVEEQEQQRDEAVPSGDRQVEVRTVEVPTREQWVTPSISVIQQPLDLVPAVDAPAEPVEQTRPQPPADIEQNGQLFSAISPPVPSLRYSTNSQLSPVILVVVLAIAAVVSLFVLARFERHQNKNQVPVQVPATNNVRDPASDGIDSPALSGATNPPVISQPAGSQKMIEDPGTSTDGPSLPAVANRGVSEASAKAGSGRRSVQRPTRAKRRWRQPSRYRGSFYFDQRHN